MRLPAIPKLRLLAASESMDSGQEQQFEDSSDEEELASTAADGSLSTSASTLNAPFLTVPRVPALALAAPAPQVKPNSADQSVHKRQLGEYHCAAL